MATIQEVVQDLNVESPIDLFTLSGPGLPTYRFCNIGRVAFGGVIYLPAPGKIEWLTKSGEGTEPRLTMVMSDVLGDIADLIDNYVGLIGGFISVKRTFSIFLDGQPGANATMFTPLEMRINQYTGIFSSDFEFTLMSSTELGRKQIPSKTYLRHCQYILSDENCRASTVNNFDLAGNITTPDKRTCSQDPAGCMRYQGNTRNYGGFLGVQNRN